MNASSHDAAGLAIDRLARIEAKLNLLVPPVPSLVGQRIREAKMKVRNAFGVAGRTGNIEQVREILKEANEILTLAEQACERFK